MELRRDCWTHTHGVRWRLRLEAYTLCPRGGSFLCVRYREQPQRAQPQPYYEHSADTTSKRPKDLYMNLERTKRIDQESSRRDLSLTSEAASLQRGRGWGSLAVVEDSLQLLQSAFIATCIAHHHHHHHWSAIVQGIFSGHKMS